MSGADRRVVVALCAIVAITFIVSASLTFTLSPMINELSLTSEQSDTVLAIPSIASLFVVFLAGRLGDRLGHRRIIIWASAAFIVGSAVTAAAPAMGQVILGLVLAGASATAIQIVVLGQLQQSFPTGRVRVAAFTSYGMMFPLVYLVVPVLTGWILLEMSWRWIPVFWAVAGALIPIAALSSLPRASRRGPIGELATPIIAGIALAAIVETVCLRQSYGLGSARSIAFGVIALASLAVWIVLTRRLRTPSVSLTALRAPGMKLLIFAVLVVAMVCTLVFVTLGVEYLYELTSLQAALALVPAQLGAVLGAKLLAAWLMRRFRMPTAICVTLAALAISVSLLVVVSAQSPLWLPIAIGAVFSAFGLAAITILNAAVMGRAPEGDAGMVSAIRGAASAIGAALGVSIVGAGVVAAVRLQDASGVPNPDGLVQGFQYEGVLSAVLVTLVLIVFVLRRNEITRT